MMECAIEARLRLLRKYNATGIEATKATVLPSLEGGEETVA